MAIGSALDFIKNEEKFTAKSFWDNKQWTWGYGTKAPGANATISKANAVIELQAYTANDQKKINSALNRPISNNANTGLLSFSFNLGFGIAAKLIADINAGKTMQQVAARAKLYIYSDGKISAGLVSRREREATLMIS